MIPCQGVRHITVGYVPRNRARTLCAGSLTLVILAAGEVGEAGLSMLDGLPVVGNMSLGGFVILIFLLVYTGRLVPKRHLDDARADLAKSQETNANLLATLGEMKDAVKESVELGKSADHLLRGLQYRADQSREAASS